MEESLKIWKRLARTFQQSCSNSLGDRMYDRVNEEQLALKVGYAIYNAPSEMSESNKTAVYTKKQQDHINLLCDKIKSLQPSNDGFYYFSCVYVVIRLRNKKEEVGVDVLFRIPQFANGEPCDNSYLFLDTKPRKYDSWDLYLKKNKLPKCDMCYPTNGVYSTGRVVDLTFAESNACNTRTTIFNVLDISSTALLVGATGVSLASLAVPIAAPVIWGVTATVIATGSYDAARKVYSLHDIKKHGESIGLKNPDARSAWLNLAGSVVGMASIGTTAVAKSVVATESAISRTGILTLRVLNVSSLAVNGIGVLNGIVTLIMKYVNGTLEKKDVVQFTFVCLFFVNAVVTYNVAAKLLEELASSDMKNLLNLRENSSFQVIKNITEFNDLTSLNILRSLISGFKSVFYPHINTEDMEVMILKVFVLILKLSSGKVSWNHFSQEMIYTLSKIWIKYQDVILKVIDEMKSTVPISSWEALLPHKKTANLEIPRIMCEEVDKVIQACGIAHQSTEHKNLVMFAKAFSDCRGLRDGEFINRFKFYCDCIVTQFREEMEIYENWIDTKGAEQGFNRESFDESYGIEGRLENCLFARALDKISHPDFSENMDELYNNLPKPEIEDTKLPFLQATKSRIYTFCGPLNERFLDDTFYLSRASYLTGFKFDSINSLLRRKDNFVFIQPKPDHPTSEIAELEAIVMNTSFINQYHMGLLVLLLK